MSALTTPDGGRRPVLARPQNLLGRFGLVLATLTLLLVIAPIVEMTNVNVELLSVSLTLVLGSGVYALSRRPWVLKLGVGIGLPAFLIEWTSNYYPTAPLVMANLGTFVVFLGFLGCVITYEMFQEDRVRLDTIFGGITIYLLFGLIWAFAFSIVEHLTPGSYPSLGSPLQELRPRYEFLFPELIYFSFVTLTTLGYGDIVPTNPLARTLAILEAIVGQLYVAVAIAALVGLHLSERSKRERLGDGPDA